MTVVLVAAVARNGVIGADNAMPWHLPEDLARFKRITMGRPLVMGRRTYDSIGRPLPGRRTIVITRDRDWHVDGVTAVGSVGDALALAAQGPGAAAPDAGSDEIMVVGGGQIYAETMPLADRLEITHLDAEADGDTRFPVIDPDLWRATADEQLDGFRWTTYQRRTGSPSSR